MTLQQQLLHTIRDVPDFPKPGIVFKDIGPLLRDSRLFARVVRHLAEHAVDCRAEQIIGAESRGFLFGVPVARELGLPFVPARKKGKLPGKVVSQSYQLEYGVDHIEVQADALHPGQRNLIVDDVIATGGTAAAIAKLLQSQGAVTAGFSFVLELGFLNGRESLKAVSPGCGIYSLLVI